MPTSLGDSRLVVDEAADAHAVLWLGHGAGGGIGAADLAALAPRLPRLGITVVRYEQPWRVAGRKVAPRPVALDAAWLETAPRVAELAGGRPIIAGGRSAGARVACRTASAVAELVPAIWRRPFVATAPLTAPVCRVCARPAGRGCAGRARMRREGADARSGARLRPSSPRPSQPASSPARE